MKIAVTVSALALATLPVMAFAKCGGDMVKGETASSCVPGATWDAEKGACIVNPSS